MSIIDLTAGNEIRFEDEPQELGRQQLGPLHIRPTIRFDSRVYTLEEFRTWVRHLADVETSTDPERAHIVEQMRNHIHQQDEAASVLAGTLTAQIRELQEELKRVKAERDALIRESAPQEIPRSVNTVEGCDCGGTVHHRAAFNGQPACSIYNLDDTQAAANIEAAEERTIAYVANLPKPGATAHQVEAEYHLVDLGPMNIGGRFFDQMAPSGACTLRCPCGWNWNGPAAQAEGIAAAHEEGTA